MFEKATAAFRRVLVQDHDNIEALLATAKVVHNFLAMRLTQALRLTMGCSMAFVQVKVETYFRTHIAALKKSLLLKAGKAYFEAVSLLWHRSKKVPLIIDANRRACGSNSVPWNAATLALEMAVGYSKKRASCHHVRHRPPTGETLVLPP